MEAVAATHLEQWCRQTDRLVAELSSTLGDIESADLGNAIEPMLQQICEAVGVDRAVLVEYGGGDPEHAFRWAAPSIETDAEPLDPAQALWLWDWLRPKRDALVLERIPADLPPRALTPTVLEHLRPLPMRSLVVMPARIGGDLVCALSLEAVHDDHSWPAPLVERLQLLPTIIAGYMYRRRQDIALRQSHSDLARLMAQLEREKEPFDDEDPPVHDFEEIIGK